VLARLILGHETAHQFIDHPTLDPDQRAWPADMLRRASSLRMVSGRSSSPSNLPISRGASSAFRYRHR
jgi:hypothetical protein